MFLFYNSHPFQSIYLYELLIREIENSLSLVSLGHQVLQLLHLCFLLLLNLHSMYYVLVLL